MTKPTDRYRKLLEKEKDKLTSHINSVFYSMEIILDNVDQRIQQREIAADVKGKYETKTEASRSQKDSSKKDNTTK